MKKIAAIILSCLMIVGLFCACGEKIEPAPVEPAESNNAGMPNPMVEVSADEMTSKLGLSFGTVQEAQNVKYFIINDELGEMQCDIPGAKITVRVKAAAEYEDISGVYGEPSVSSDCDINGREGKDMRFVSEDGTTDVCLWYDVVPGVMYCVTASGADLDGFDITAVAEQIFVPVQGEAE